MAHFISKTLMLFLCVLITAGSVSMARAQAETVQPAPYQATFLFRWGAMPVGKLTLDIAETAQRYRVDTNAKTSGLVRIFSRHKSHAFAEGKKDDARIRPIQFRSDYRSGGQDKVIETRYDANGVITQEILVPEREESRPEVPATMKGEGVLDILSTLISMREQLRGLLACTSMPCPTQFTAPIYDGKRRFNLEATLQPQRKTIAYKGGKQEAIVLSLQRVALAGYTAKETKKLTASNPVVTFYVHPDDLSPLGFEMPVYGATLSALVE